MKTKIVLKVYYRKSKIIPLHFAELSRLSLNATLTFNSFRLEFNSDPKYQARYVTSRHQKLFEMSYTAFNNPSIIAFSPSPGLLHSPFSSSFSSSPASTKSLSLYSYFRPSQLAHIYIALNRRHSNPLQKSSSPVFMSADPSDVAVILLAGGIGKRMKSKQPKQFLELRGKPVLQHSIDLFANMHQVSSIIVVLDPMYREEYQQALNHAASLHGRSPSAVAFADPGKERQDSVYNALQLVPKTDPNRLVCVHDAARPLITVHCVQSVLKDAAQYQGAAVVGVPAKATIKESEDGQFVLRTIERSRLWEIQTPQVIRRGLLQEGFDNAMSKSLAVTDDVSLVEYLGVPVKLTLGEYTNLKLTTPEDLIIAESIMADREASQ